MKFRRISIPVSFFGMGVGVLALANAWHVGTRIWKLPVELANALTLAGLAVWAALVVLYAMKWQWHRADATAELQHPVQSSFVALVPVSTLLAAMALLPLYRPAAIVLFGFALVGQIALGLWLYGRFWQGGRRPELVTAAVYLPAVAQNFVAGTAAAVFGWPQLGTFFFGAGLFSWLALESMILSRAATQEPLPEALRPVLGIQLAPAVVGGVTYMSITSGAPDLFAQMLLGYGMYQALLLLRLLPWIRAQAFAPSYWAFSFGVAALPTLAMRMVERGATGPVEWLAPALFVGANIVFGILVSKTLAMLFQGRLLPVSVPAVLPVVSPLVPTSANRLIAAAASSERLS
jgi:tellurite resistance protein